MQEQEFRRDIPLRLATHRSHSVVVFHQRRDPRRDFRLIMKPPIYDGKVDFQKYTLAVNLDCG